MCRRSSRVANRWSGVGMSCGMLSEEEEIGDDGSDTEEVQEQIEVRG
jgi:hypothetical protein